MLPLQISPLKTAETAIPFRPTIPPHTAEVAGSIPAAPRPSSHSEACRCSYGENRAAEGAVARALRSEERPLFDAQLQLDLRAVPLVRDVPQSILRFYPSISTEPGTSPMSGSAGSNHRTVKLRGRVVRDAGMRSPNRLVRKRFRRRQGSLGSSPPSDQQRPWREARSEGIQGVSCEFRLLPDQQRSRYGSCPNARALEG